LARFKANWALRIRFSGPPTSVFISAQPIAQSIRISRSERRNGVAIDACSRRAATSASSLPLQARSRMANSSPPIRASMSPDRNAATMRRATVMISSSPAIEPMLSLMRLKRVRSTTSKAKLAPVAATSSSSPIAASTASVKATLFGRPVRLSCSISARNDRSFSISAVRSTSESTQRRS
jgi:hypothetical protein